MARKKIENIISLGNEDKLTVQKSLPLFALWRSDLTLAEFKLLDTYLSRIDSHHPEKRMVVLEKGELEKVLGVKKINNQDLKERLKHLMSNVVEIPDSSVKRGIRLVTLFEEATAEQDEETDLWTVKLECTQKAMKYFFNIENLGYLRYKLRCITSITSRYSYIMFIYLEANRYRKSWIVSVDELKKILNCDEEESYKAFKRFNDLILKKTQKELLEKTECRYRYEPVKAGRSVKAIKFTVETLTKEIEEDVNQMTIDEWQNEVISKMELWEQPIKDAGWNFKGQQYDEIFALLSTVPREKLPVSPDNPDDIELSRYHYIAQKVAEIKRRDMKDPIKSKFAYLKKIVKQDSVPSVPEEIDWQKLIE